MLFFNQIVNSIVDLIANENKKDLNTEMSPFSVNCQCFVPPVSPNCKRLNLCFTLNVKDSSFEVFIKYVSNTFLKRINGYVKGTEMKPLQSDDFNVSILGLNKDSFPNFKLTGNKWSTMRIKIKPNQGHENNLKQAVQGFIVGWNNEVKNIPTPQKYCPYSS